MILTEEIQQKIIATIEQDRTSPVVLPEHAYDVDGEVRVMIDRLPVHLHRHLHNLLIRPLGYRERMHDQSGVKGNVNPYLFKVVEGNRSPATHCHKGHLYEANEMPPNSRGYRCKQCYLNSQPEPHGTPNRDKTHCPQDHPYDEKNTIIDSAGRRRCDICTKEAKLKYVRRIRAQRKESK